MTTPTKIFISYRREDSAAVTGRLYDWLIQRVPKTELFFDVELNMEKTSFAASKRPLNRPKSCSW
jgi:hypothetical protein